MCSTLPCIAGVLNLSNGVRGHGLPLIQMQWRRGTAWLCGAWDGCINGNLSPAAKFADPWGALWARYNDSVGQILSTPALSSYISLTYSIPCHYNNLWPWIKLYIGYSWVVNETQIQDVCKKVSNYKCTHFHLLHFLPFPVACFS